MCKDCGCSDPPANASASHVYHHDVNHGHAHGNSVGPPETTLRLEQAILQKNDRLAQRNRDWLTRRRILALNLLSSPGAGKTALLERTIRDLGQEFAFQVIEGDQATDHDAERIRAAGCRAVQI